ncbi:hypothetical protein I1A62_03950 (plasmid) [Rhodococcus sp. USK10]|uniref:hypothetical protein n=1 Tax=Rhodococcus sp. USK10 TaxID=2789739 RepID=UPI001C5EEA65|nr:hypothetical protein [Rhodococcus sp. USK10]QYB00230.1 hypothetical protein I1A62_03950 [Rhodococcus sp. USK10]
MLNWRFSQDAAENAIYTINIHEIGGDYGELEVDQEYGGVGREISPNVNRLTCGFSKRVSGVSQSVSVATTCCVRAELGFQAG